MLKYNIMSQNINIKCVFFGVIFMKLISTAAVEERITVSGSMCIFPQIFNDTQYEDCFQVNGKQMCYIEDQLEPCIIINPQPPLLNSPPVPTPTRYTTHGTACDETYLYKGKKYSGCMTIANVEYCEVTGILYKCKPDNTTPITTPTPNVRYTVYGNKCDESYLYRGIKYSGCMKIGVSEYCEVKGILYKCRPDNQQNNTTDFIDSTNNSTNITDTTRYTLHGVTCNEKYLYKGQEYSGCMTIGNSEYCEVNGILYQCRPNNNTINITVPLVEQNMVHDLPQAEEEDSDELQTVRITTDGRICTIPFRYNQYVFYDCTIINDQESCYIDKEWYQCVPIQQMYKMQLRINSTVRYTMTGQLCTFPVFHEGQVYEDCFMVGNRESCEINGEFYECMQSNSSAVKNDDTTTITKNDTQITIAVNRRVSIDRELCDFPFMYRGQYQYGCLEIVGKELCQVNGTWTECAPYASQDSILEYAQSGQEEKIVRRTTKGQLCMIPFTYGAVQHEDCTIVNGIQSCYLNGVWEQCIDFQAANIAIIPNTEQGYNKNNKNGISGGGIAGIIVSVLFVVIFTGSIAAYFLYFQKRVTNKQQFMEFQEPVNGNGSNNHQVVVQREVEMQAQETMHENYGMEVVVTPVTERQSSAQV